jgi:hypothetical protein
MRLIQFGLTMRFWLTGTVDAWPQGIRHPSVKLP